jgi:hypothetical protein
MGTKPAAILKQNIALIEKTMFCFLFYGDKKFKINHQ